MAADKKKHEDHEDHDKPVIRDKRRIDPDTGAVRQPHGEERKPATPSGADANEFVQSEAPDIETALSDADLNVLSGQSGVEAIAAERLADLQRVTAEYANYRKRTEANRHVERERVIGETIAVLLPALDDVDRAERHGDLAGEPFATIAQKLRSGVEKLGLKSFAEQGDVFDPTIHEAISQRPTPDVEAETIADVVETGYFVGSTLLRAAKVVVTVPA